MKKTQICYAYSIIDAEQRNVEQGEMQDENKRVMLVALLYLPLRYGDYSLCRIY